MDFRNLTRNLVQFSLLGDHLTGWILVGLVTTAFLFLRRLSSEYQLSRFPLVGKELGNRRARVHEFLTRPREMYEKGYRQVRSSFLLLAVISQDPAHVPRGNEAVRVLVMTTQLWQEFFQCSNLCRHLYIIHPIGADFMTHS